MRRKGDLITTKNTEGHGKANKAFITAENAENAENCASRISLREHEVCFARFAHSSRLIYHNDH